jgi:hypothetical protein
MKNLKLLMKIEKTVHGRLADSQIDAEPLLNPELTNEQVGELFRALVGAGERSIDLLNP